MSEQLLGASGQPRPNRHLHLRKCQPARRRRSAFCWERNPWGTFVRFLASVNPGARWTHRQRLRRPHSTPHAKRLMQEVPGFSAPRNWEMPLEGEAGLQTAGDLLKKKKKPPPACGRRDLVGLCGGGTREGPTKTGQTLRAQKAERKVSARVSPHPRREPVGGGGGAREEGQWPLEGREHIPSLHSPEQWEFSGQGCGEALRPGRQLGEVWAHGGCRPGGPAALTLCLPSTLLSVLSFTLSRGSPPPGGGDGDSGQEAAPFLAGFHVTTQTTFRAGNSRGWGAGPLHH